MTLMQRTTLHALAFAAWAGLTLPAAAQVDPITPRVRVPESMSPSRPPKTFHVRADGADYAKCSGEVDAPYSPEAKRACAWNGPMVALPPSGSARIFGGDTLIVHAGQYKIGLGAPGAEYCSSQMPWECSPAPIPSGPDADHPTRILGEGYDKGCPAAPQFWGTERVGHVLSLKDTKHAVVSCLEITDHAACVEFHGGPNPTALTCERNKYPYGDWASTGLSASDSSDVLLQDLNIHGLANRGVSAGRLSNWTVRRVRIAANGWAGWDGDIGEQSSNSGVLRFEKWVVEWNGCGETYPGNKPTGCWAQTAGGYGDGVGTGKTGGDWIIEDSIFRFNTSDGLDLLYHKGPGSITLNRVWAEGNAGNQIKIVGATSLKNSVVIGNCGFFKGKPFTHHVDDCRAGGDAVGLGPTKPGQKAYIINNTIVSEGNVAILTGGPPNTSLRLINNIIVGLPFFLSPEKNSADIYMDGAPGLVIEDSHNVKQGLRNANCRGPGVICTNDAGLVSASRGGVNPELRKGSPALDSGLANDRDVPPTDYRGNKRPAGAGIDRGALEMPARP